MTSSILSLLLLLVSLSTVRTYHHYVEIAWNIDIGRVVFSSQHLAFNVSDSYLLSILYRPPPYINLIIGVWCHSGEKL